MAYTIEKVPTPRGTLRELATPVAVENVTGVDNVYVEDGELRGSFDVELADNEYIYIVETYTRTYESGDVRTFSCQARQTPDKPSFSLSLAPFVPYLDSPVAKVDISVESEKMAKPSKARVTA